MKEVEMKKIIKVSAEQKYLINKKVRSSFLLVMLTFIAEFFANLDVYLKIFADKNYFLLMFYMFLIIFMAFTTYKSIFISTMILELRVYDHYMYRTLVKNFLLLLIELISIVIIIFFMHKVIIYFLILFFILHLISYAYFVFVVYKNGLDSQSSLDEFFSHNRCK